MQKQRKRAADKGKAFELCRKMGHLMYELDPYEFWNEKPDHMTDEEFIEDFCTTNMVAVRDMMEVCDLLAEDEECYSDTLKEIHNLFEEIA